MHTTRSKAEFGFIVSEREDNEAEAQRVTSACLGKRLTNGGVSPPAKQLAF